MRVGKPKANRSIWVAIILGLTGGLVVAWLTYHIHAITPGSPLDDVAGSYSQ